LLTSTRLHSKHPIITTLQPWLLLTRQPTPAPSAAKLPAHSVLVAQTAENSHVFISHRLTTAVRTVRLLTGLLTRTPARLFRPRSSSTAQVRFSKNASLLHGQRRSTCVSPMSSNSGDGTIHLFDKPVDRVGPFPPSFTNDIKTKNAVLSYGAEHDAFSGLMFELGKRAFKGRSSRHEHDTHIHAKLVHRQATPRKLKKSMCAFSGCAS